MTLRIELLDQHDTSTFSCGVDDLDRWLIDASRSAMVRGVRTHVLIDDADHVVGYFAIAPTVLASADAPRPLARGTRTNIPAILLARFALDRSLHGSGLGGEFLVAAMTMIVEMARKVGGRVLLVDAIDADAARFYEHFGFSPITDDRARLLIKLSSVARSIGVDWP